MRRPQPIIESLHVRTVHFLTIGIAIAFLGMFPVNAGATTPQLTCTPANLAFGWVVVGQTETLVVSLTNNGQTSVTVSGIAMSSSQFTVSNLGLPLVLPAGQSVDLNVSFTATAGSTVGTVQFSSNASNASLVLDVRGGGVTSESLIASPSTVPFGPVAIGSSSTVPVMLTNDRSWNLTLGGAQTTGSGFSVSGASFPLTLNAGQSVTLNVSFTPHSAGTVGGSLFVSGVALTVPLTGTGTTDPTTPTPTPVGTLSVSPSIAVGNTLVGTSGTATGTLTASGASVTVSSVTLGGANPSEFSISGVTFPVTVTTSQPVPFTVTFIPGASGAASATVSFASNASNTPSVANLTGTGTAAPVHTVTLNWAASTTTGITNYNVYRANFTSGACSAFPIGSPYGSTASTVTTFTDPTVTNGNTYCYATTTVVPSGESGVSNVVQVTIP